MRGRGRGGAAATKRTAARSPWPTGDNLDECRSLYDTYTSCVQVSPSLVQVSPSLVQDKCLPLSLVTAHYRKRS